MPLCEVTISQGLLSRKREETLIRSIEGHLLEAEGLASGDITRDMCSFVIDKNRQMFTGNGIRQRRKAIVKVRFLDGTVAEASKAKLIRDMTDAIKRACKSIDDRDIWCILTPVQNGCFGVAGNSISPELIRGIADAEE